VQFRIGTSARGIGAAVFACLLAASVPASAATTVTIDGTVMTVWERGSPIVIEDATPLSGPEIAFSVSDPYGTRVGTIAPTGDPALDASPFLAVEPASRTPVAVWSRFDGTSRKIAYARFEGGEWNDFHYLTFGRTDDTLPRLGISQTGAYLFWVSNTARYMYAPVDLSTGRLFAPPRAITIGSLQRPQESLLSTADAYTVQGGSDVPVVIGKGGNSTRPLLNLSGGEMVQGGSDVPIVIGRAAIWGVSSSNDCRDLMLVIPHPSLRSVFVVRFTDGWIQLLREIVVPSPLPETFAEDTAGIFLKSACP